VDIVPSAPDDHLTAGPHGRVRVASLGCVRGTSRYPTVRAGIVSAPVVKIDRRAAKNATPDDHFVAGPYRGVRVSRRGRVGDAGGHPAIASRIVSAARVAIVKRGVDAAPDDHFAAGPYRGVTSTTQYIIWDAGGRPTVVGRVILATGV
jgi:hypothetical protein